MTVPALEAATGVRRGRLELLVKVLAVDGAVVRSSEGWASTGEPWVYDAAHYDDLLASRRAEAELMRAYAHGAGCLEVLPAHRPRRRRRRGLPVRTLLGVHGSPSRRAAPAPG